MSKTDYDYMNQAFQLAEQTLENKEVPVGCLLVYQDPNNPNTTFEFSGGNETNLTKNATRHAELIAFDKAAEKADSLNLNQEIFFKNCSLFVTVEPCIMCISAINILRIKKVFYGCSNERFGGCGSVVDLPGILPMSETKIFKNFEGTGERAVKLLKTFYAYENENAPEDKKKNKQTKRRLQIIEEFYNKKMDLDDDTDFQLDLEVDRNKVNDDEDFNINAFDSNRNKRRSARRSFSSQTASSKTSSVPSPHIDVNKNIRDGRYKVKENEKLRQNVDKNKSQLHISTVDHQPIETPILSTVEAPTQSKQSEIRPLPKTTPKIKSDYKVWLQIVNDNKLSRHNPFQLKLIDYMTEMCTSNDNKNNFQFAASSVDAGARIYARKVDSAHEDVFKVLREVASDKLKESNKNTQKNGIDTEMDSNGNQVDNSNEGENYNDEGEIVTSKLKKKKKPRKRSSHLMTSEKEEAMLNKTKSSIVNPNLRYQYVLNSITSTSIGNLRLSFVVIF